MSLDSYNKWGWITVLLTCALSVTWILYFMFVQVPIDLDEVGEVSPPVESIPLDISGVKDYWLTSELMVAKGKELYNQYCALCHGPTGKGDGVAGRGLKPAPRNFISGDWKYGGRSQDLYNIITKGSPGTSMASFSHVPKLERWALVHFVRSLTKKPVKDSPEQLKNFATQSK